MKTILIVDDEFGLVETLTNVLGDLGYRVASAANGRDGLARVEKENPDLVLVDYMMPIADGRSLVLGMRALPAYQSVPVVMMSSVAESIALSNGQKGGRLEVSGFLSKPFELSQLLGTIERLIGASARTAEDGMKTK
jgi:CheY-like chemotaxis protein